MDTKISALTSATTLNTGDYLPLVQAGTTLKVDIATFLNNLPSNPKVAQAIEALSVAGAISTTISSTTITSASGAVAYTLAAGTHGIRKVIASQVMGVGATAVVTVTSGTGFTTLTFNAAGDAIVLQNINGFWFIVGNNSVAVV